ncbi:MFS transporter [Chloroflexota bacterium]
MKLKHFHYGWVIVILAIFILFAHAVIFYTFGIFLTPLTTEFNWDRGALSAASSIYVIISGLVAIFAGRLSDRYGPRPLLTLSGLFTGVGFLLMSQVSSLWQVYLVWGVFFGVGGGSCVVPILSTMARWFAKKRGMAIGATFAGAGLGGMISPPLAQWLISSYGWQQAYVIQGLLTFIIIVPLAQFMKRSPQRIGLRPYGDNGTIEDKQSLASAAEGITLTQAIKTSRFWILSSVIFCSLFAILLVIVHIAPYAVDIGISPIVAASILSAIPAASTIGRFSLGFISDKVGAKPAITACLITLTLALIWLLFAKETWMFYVFAAVFGVAYGGIISLQPLISAELFGLSSLGTILATVVLCGTTGGALGPPLAGRIFDITESYSLAFLICLVMCALGVTLSLILLRSKGKGEASTTENKISVLL